jgi:hypothetical protein
LPELLQRFGECLLFYFIIKAGATAFGIKSGKNSEMLKEALRSSPKGEPFSEEEWASLMEQITNDK